MIPDFISGLAKLAMIFVLAVVAMSLVGGVVYVAFTFLRMHVAAIAPSWGFAKAFLSATCCGTGAAIIFSMSLKE